MPKRKLPHLTDDELERALEDIVRNATSAVARIQAIKELRVIRAARGGAVGDADPFEALEHDELAQRRAASA